MVKKNFRKKNNINNEHIVLTRSVCYLSCQLLYANLSEDGLPWELIAHQVTELEVQSSEIALQYAIDIVVSNYHLEKNTIDIVVSNYHQEKISENSK